MVRLSTVWGPHPVKMTEGVLVESFSEFVALRGSVLWRSAWLLTGDAALAEDLLQTALAKAWPHYDRVEVFEAYVRRTMHTTYNSWWRRRWRGEVPGHRCLTKRQSPAMPICPRTYAGHSRTCPRGSAR